VPSRSRIIKLNKQQGGFMKRLTPGNIPQDECFFFLKKYSWPVIGEVKGFTPSSCFGPAYWNVTIEDPNQAGAFIDLSLTPDEILGVA
jgi:hypothetical protein